MRRSSITISPIVSSATLRVFENGALKTGRPRARAVLEVDLVGPDAEAADGGQIGQRVEQRGGDFRARADAEDRGAGKITGILGADGPRQLPDVADPGLREDLGRCRRYAFGQNDALGQHGLSSFDGRNLTYDLAAAAAQRQGRATHARPSGAERPPRATGPG
jgi:hypothetical protein